MAEGGTASYGRLDSRQIVQTIGLLSRRIDQRFPGAGLGQVCLRLLETARQAEARADWIARPLVTLRVATGILLVLIAAGLAATFVGLRVPAGDLDFLEFITVLEAGINDIVLIGAGVFFLVTLEGRVKRNRALAAIHELRVIAHIIDMHQLTKDPERTLRRLEPTSASPQRLPAPLMARYLDYCSEMLSLTGKLAALYVENLNDATAIASANEVETLTTGLSRKIWQKMTLLHVLEIPQPGPAARGSAAGS